VVAYTEEERLIGDSAMNQIKKNFKNTLQFYSRYLGLNSDCVDQLKEEEKFVTYKVLPLENKKIGFEVTHKGKQAVYTPEQVLAFFLRRTKKFFELGNIHTKDIVVSVPSYFSNVERQAVLDACEIAHYKCIRLVNESTAVCLNYGFFRKTDLPEKGEPKNVAFVDLGHSKLTVTIAAFHQGKVKILCHNSDRNLGARNFDY
jgi:molecular chaperone DnaK (HSP70)